MNRFLAQVKIPEDTAGCWVWTGKTTRQHVGYGVFYVNRERVLAHRFSYQWFRGPINGLCVLHTCDNSVCVNPTHLFLGTQRDNILDMCKKKRDKHPTGVVHYRYKVTPAMVAEVRKRYTQGETMDHIAFTLAIGKSTVGHIVAPNSRYR